MRAPERRWSGSTAALTQRLRTRLGAVHGNHGSGATGGHAPMSLNRSAVGATVHCLTGCAIGEVLGMVIATAFGWGNASSIAVSVLLAFLFGYSLTVRPVLRAGVGPRRAIRVAFASDTVSIATMETV